MQPRKYSIPAMGTLTLAATMGAGCADEFEGLEGSWTGARLTIDGAAYDLPFTYEYTYEAYTIRTVFDTRMSVDEDGIADWEISQDVFIDDQLYQENDSTYSGIAERLDNDDIWRIPMDPDDPEGRRLILECSEGSDEDTLVCDEFNVEGSLTGYVWTFER